MGENKHILAITFIWFVPAFLFYCLVYIANGGYILSHLVSVYILIGIWLKDLLKNKGKLVVTLAVLVISLVQAGQFWFGTPLPEKSLLNKSLNRVFYRFTRAGVDVEFRPLHS